MSSKLGKYAREEERWAMELRKHDEKLKNANQRKREAVQNIEKLYAEYQSAKEIYKELLDENGVGNPDSTNPWDKFLCRKEKYIRQIEVLKGKLDEETEGKQEAYKNLRATRRVNPPESVLWVSVIADHADRIRDISSEIYDIYKMIERDKQKALESPQCKEVFDFYKKAHDEYFNARELIEAINAEISEVLALRDKAFKAHREARKRLDEARTSC